MIPVEEHSTNSSSRLKRFATNSVIRWALSKPRSPVAQFALPLLTITACAFPFFKRSWQTMTGAARVLLVVKVPAATQGTSEIKIARSLIATSDLMPHAVTPARKPLGAVTQLTTSRNMSDKEKYLLPKVKRVKSFQFPRHVFPSVVSNSGNENYVSCSIVQCGKLAAQPQGKSRGRIYELSNKRASRYRAPARGAPTFHVAALGWEM
jgi:hypothetical protein